MTHEQFTYWLKGFIEDKQTLTELEIEKIKAKSNEIVPEFKWNDSPFAPIYPPYGDTILCGDSMTTGNTTGYPTGTTTNPTGVPFTLTNN
jgi:hypothetical protein